jgi:hypothetical protein
VKPDPVLELLAGSKRGRKRGLQNRIVHARISG